MITEQQIKYAANVFTEKERTKLEREEYATFTDTDEWQLSKGFEAGAKWAMEEAKKNEECLWCGYTAKNCDCTFTEGKFQEEKISFR